MNHHDIRAALPGIIDACRVTRAVQLKLDEIKSITKDDRSPVTVADFAAQAIIARHLLEIEGSGLNLVGEESGAALKASTTLADAVVTACRTVWPEANRDAVIAAVDAGNHDASASRYWTLDPIDGTKGFLRGGQYAMALALIDRGTVVCGALGCPNLAPDMAAPLDKVPPGGTVFYATRDAGAMGAPVGDAEAAAPVTAGTAASGTVRVCESVESAHSKHDDTARIIAALGVPADAVRLDSQTKYAVVARGQADIYLRMPTRADYVERIWDHAAGMIVASEAGAVVTDADGKPLDFGHGAGLPENRGIVCAHPDFHGRVVEAIRALGL